MKVPYLTKSRYVTGQKCPKWAWQGFHDPLPYADPDPGTPQAVGTVVGEKARLLFPGGVLVEEGPYEHKQAVERTTALMDDPSVPAIFEAAFEFQNIRICVDILHRLPDGWGIIEVKSSSGVKEQYLDDLAVQTHVLIGCGVALKSIELAHVNSDYVRGANGIDWSQLFTRVNLAADVNDALPEVPGKAVALLDMLAQPSPPDIEPGKDCDKDCDFWERCTANKPVDWIIKLPGIRKPLFDRLVTDGYEAISDIPTDNPLNATQETVRRVLVSGEPYISPDLPKTLKEFELPAFYMDFEAVGPAIPLYEGTSPYKALPFQWSLHHQDEAGSLTHWEFLASGATDPRREFAETLIAALEGTEGPIIVYSSYEKTTLNGLIKTFPNLAYPLNAIIDRLADLLKVVKGYTYFEGYEGSFSIKTVGPSLAPNVDYKDLDHVNNGLAAAATFERIANGTLEPDEDAITLRSALLEYCKLDTLAMVEVHRKLMELATAFPTR